MTEQDEIRQQKFQEALALFGAVYIQENGQFVNIAKVADIHTERVTARFDPEQDHFVRTTQITEYYGESENTAEQLFGAPLEIVRYYFRKI